MLARERSNADGKQPRVISQLSGCEKAMTAVALLILIEQAFPNLSVEASVSLAGLASNAPVPRLYKFSTLQQGTPWDTFTLLALWAYSTHGTG